MTQLLFQPLQQSPRIYLSVGKNAFGFFLSIITYLLDILLAYSVGCLYVILCIFCRHYSGASFAPWLLHTWVVAVIEDKWATLLASVRLPVSKSDPQAALLRWKAQRVTSEGDADTPTHLSVPLFSSFTLKCPAHWCQREGGIAGQQVQSKSGPAAQLRRLTKQYRHTPTISSCTNIARSHRAEGSASGAL